MRQSTCKRLREPGQRANMDLETNHWRISLVLSLFHPDTLYPQQSAQMERQGQRERRDICLHCTTQCHSCTSACQASHYPYEHMYTRTYAGTHTNTYAIVSDILQCGSSSRPGFHQQRIHVKGRTAQAESLKLHQTLVTENGKIVLQRICYPGEHYANKHHAP